MSGTKNAAIRRSERVLALVADAQSVLKCLRPSADECRGRYADGTPQYLQVLDAENALSRIRDLLFTPKRRRIRALEPAGEQIRMNVTGHMSPKSLKENIPTDDPIEAVEKFREKYPDAIIDTVDGVAIRNICDTCNMPIFVGDLNHGKGSYDTYEYDGDLNTYRCGECVEKLRKGEDL